MTDKKIDQLPVPETREQFRSIVSSMWESVVESLTTACFEYKKTPAELVTLMLDMNCDNARICFATLMATKRFDKGEDAHAYVQAYVATQEQRGEVLFISLPLLVVQALLKLLQDDENVEALHVRDSPHDTWILGAVQGYVWLDRFELIDESVQQVLKKD